jgi:hypothetical protein
MAIITAQRDFSSGELNVDATRRDDQPVMRAGARQLRNVRVLNSGAVTNRAGRRALFGGAPRVDEVLVAPGLLFYLRFYATSLEIYDANFNQVGINTNAYLWTTDTVRQIVWTVVPISAGRRDIVITFPGQPPKVATWNSNGSWLFNDFSFATGTDTSVLMPFYRLSTPGVSILPSGYSGNIALVASAGVFVAGMVNTIIRFYGQQIFITGYTDSQHVSARVIQQLFPAVSLAATGGFTGTFSVGDIISDTSGLQAEVVSISITGGAIVSLQVNMMQPRVWPNNTALVGPSGSFIMTSSNASAAPGASPQWDDAVFSTYRGWPQSCFFDQDRLGFCDIPALPSGIAWSGIGLFTNFEIGADPSDAMLELAPERSRVLHVATKQDEIILTDRGIWYIPISETNPLKPGSVVFKKVSVDAASGIRPSETNEGVVFISAGLNRIVAIVPTGSLTNQWQARETSLFHQHLFNQPFGIASTTGDDAFAERYVYVLNGDGSVVVGKYDAGKEWVGWAPWDSKGVPKWVSVLGGTTIITSLYSGTYITEIIDPTIYLDGAILVNSPPVPIAPAVGNGPFWWLPNGSVVLMDGVKTLGTYAIDGTGHVIPNSPGEDLSSVTLMGGQPWICTIEPFIPNADTGADQKQRMRRRRVMRVAVTVQSSTGFKISKLYAGPTGPNLPAAGTEMGSHRVPSWNQGDNQALAPPLRNLTETWRPTGRAYDPRVAIIKDVPGPITVAEIAMEVST